MALEYGARYRRIFKTEEEFRTWSATGLSYLGGASPERFAELEGAELLDQLVFGPSGEGLYDLYEVGDDWEFELEAPPARPEEFTAPEDTEIFRENFPRKEE